ncbi:MAG: lysophospholipid acyltransferase family protein [Myxococcota bacterium]|nr:lysophospholipid acyltransferase family protein [Myxococcota bacterium]
MSATEKTPEPSAGQLARLAPAERWGFQIADRVHRHARWAAVAWNSTVLVGVTWLTCKRRIHVTGLEHLEKLDPSRGILLVANHRSFFDYFTVACAWFNWTDLPRDVVFPVRSTFFYDSPVGWGVNTFMSGMAMFPPIKRSRDGAIWNRYALHRLAYELQETGAVVGIHPEGRRYPDADPFALHRLKPGASQVALDAPDSQLVPVFLTGLTNDLWQEFLWNWLEPDEHPIGIAFGAEIDISDLRSIHADDEDSEPARRVVELVTQRIGDALKAQAEACREVLEQAREKVRAA